MKGYVRIRSVALGTAGVILAILLIACLNAYRRPPFHTSVNGFSGKDELYPYWRAEKNYIDRYGNLWVFDVYINQIAILQPGMSYFVNHGYIESEKVYTPADDDSSGVSYMGTFRHNEGNESKWVADDPEFVYRLWGHWVNFEYDRSSATFFTCCPLRTRVPLKHDTLMIGVGDSLEVYELADGAAQRILYGNRIFQEDDAIDELVRNTIVSDKEWLIAKIKN